MAPFSRRFQPDASQRSAEPWITVVVVSRLTYRKAGVSRCCWVGFWTSQIWSNINGGFRWQLWLSQGASSGLLKFYLHWFSIRKVLKQNHSANGTSWNGLTILYPSPLDVARVWTCWWRGAGDLPQALIEMVLICSLIFFVPHWWIHHLGLRIFFCFCPVP